MDKSTDNTDTAQLAIFVPGVDANFHCTEEILALQPMQDTTTGEDIFQEVKNAFGKFELNCAMLCGIATDGPPTMVGSNIAAVTKIKSELNTKRA